METLELVSFALALVSGLALGLTGGGGSILAVPILVYVAQKDPGNATAYSLFIVGASALVGGLDKSREQLVHWKTVLVFGLPAIPAVFGTRYLLSKLPAELFSIGDFMVEKDALIMVFFAVIMLLASISMIRSGRKKTPEPDTDEIQYNVPLIVLEGVIVGIVTGLVGAGGGFLIVPALVLLARLPMKLAVGTSLMIIAAKSLIGFTGDLGAGREIEWLFMGIFTVFTIGGTFIGNYLSRFVDSQKLKAGFGYFVLIMGVFILAQQLFFPMDGGGH